MKKLILLFAFFLLIGSYANAQNTLSPAMVNTAGGSGIANSIYFDYTIGEPFTAFGGTSCDSIFSGFQHCAVDTLRTKKFNLTLSGGANTTICQGSNVVLSATTGTAYVWSNGATTQSITANNTITANYTASVTNSCGNVIVSNPITINVITPPTPNLCLVTVDSLSVNNEIYWEKTLYPMADSFIVHREVSTGVYKRIAAISKNAFSMYTDTNRSIGPNNGDPNLSAYKYKLQLRDTCGNYSSLSLWHQTIFVQDQQNGNFNWTLYDIELSASPVSNYNLKRRDLATGTETVVGSTSSNLFTDPQYATFWPTNTKWLVDAIGFNCNPTAKVAAQKVKTKSNHSNDKIITTKIDNLNSFINNNIRVYPNPAKDKLTVEIELINENVSLELNDVLGQTLIKINATESINTINTSNYVRGIYFLTIKLNNKNVSVKKVVIE